MGSVVQSNDLGKDAQSVLREFLRLSDTPEEHESWINSFTSDGHVEIGGRTAQGYEEIRKLRSWIWELFLESKHIVHKTFQSNEEEEPEIAIFGDGIFMLKDKSTARVGWAAHVEFRKVGKELKIARYRTYSQAS